MSKALVVGGNSGIGLAIVFELLRSGYEYVTIVGKDNPRAEDIPAEMEALYADKVNFHRLNLVIGDFSIFDQITDIDTLVLSAGFGRVALLEDLAEPEVVNLIRVNFESNVRILKHYYEKINCQKTFYTAVLVSISGKVVSPFFSVYGATKSGLGSFIENINIELLAKGFQNRILNVSPGSVEGTNFSGKGNELCKVASIAIEIINRMKNHEALYIPHFEDVYKSVIDRYLADPIRFGVDSYHYKLKTGRLSYKPQVIIGYLSGTFDLFHTGHLNLIRRAKEQCDFLIVGVHQSGAWKGKDTFIPFEERKAIVGSIKFVDKVVKSFTEDSDAWDAFHYNKLFVGSDYKGTKRFEKYEEYFKDKGVEIVYFPYTQGTSSTKLRDALNALSRENKTE